MTNTQENYPLKEYYSKIYKRYDLVNRLFTFSQDVKWRRLSALECLSAKPEKILDLCCGTGDLAIEIARKSDKLVQITGYDFNQNMLDLAKEKAAKNTFKIDFVQGDAAEIPFLDSTFDCIGIAFGFRNLTYNNSNEQKHLSEMFRVLNAGGKLVIVESGPPQSKFVNFFYRFFLSFILVPLGGLLSGNFNAYRYLAKSSRYYYNTDELKQLLSKAGFKDFSIKKFFFGATYIISVQK